MLFINIIAIISKLLKPVLFIKIFRIDLIGIFGNYKKYILKDSKSDQICKVDEVNIRWNLLCGLYAR